MSALILQDGVEVWRQGFGRADVEASVTPTADTPYLVGGLSQVLGATLVLRKCVEQGHASLSDPVGQWIPGFSEPVTTLAHLLAHIGPSGAFRYDLSRFAALTPVIEECANKSFIEALDDEILSRFGMIDSVPGTSLAATDADAVGGGTFARYMLVLPRIARPYRVDANGRATRVDVPSTRISAASGLVTTVRDLARFDAALRNNVLLESTTLQRAWTPAVDNLPAGLGWFSQVYNNERIVWQFGQVKDAYSALIVKVPNRGLTFILLANSDALGAPFAKETWDVTASVFARLFLVVYVP